MDTALLWMTIALRIIVFALSIYGAAYTFRSFVSLTRGNQSVPTTDSAAWFFITAGLIAFQIRWFSEVPEGLNVFSLTLVGIGLGLFVWVHRRVKRKSLDRFKDIYERPDLSLALVDLARHDPAEAERMAAEARRKTAEGVASRGI